MNEDIKTLLGKYVFKIVIQIQITDKKIDNKFNKKATTILYIYTTIIMFHYNEIGWDGEKITGRLWYVNT